jgi:hypothetical protein
MRKSTIPYTERGEKMNGKAKWTFMIYFAGVNDLSKYGENDLKEIRTVGSTRDVNVFAEFDYSGNRGTQRYHVQRDGVNERVVDIKETDSGDPNTLIKFVSCSAKEFPAERYALILWSHGDGWAPWELDRIAGEAKSKDYNPREAGELLATPLKKTLFRSSIKNMFELAERREKAVCTDYASRHALDTIELGEGLAKVKETLGQELDLLGMDACLMSNLEVAYQLQSYVKYIVASEDNEPSFGWPYDKVLGKLVQFPEIETSDFAKYIVNAYIKYYKDIKYKKMPVTQSALDLSRVNTVADLLNKLADTLIKYIPKGFREVSDAMEESTNFNDNTFWDIAHFCEKLIDITKSNTVKKAATDVCLALKPRSNIFVIADSHYGAKDNRYCGVSIYLVPRIMKKRISEFYSKRKYAENSRWLHMLKAYHEA